MGLVLTIDRLARERQTARDQNKRFVFTNGCFDLVHRGHVEILKAAKGLGDLLCVGVNSDQSIRRLKGPRRPIVPEADRAAVVAALESVDFVTLFDEDTPRSVIARLRPDVLVKGADYGMDEIVGRSEVEEAGGIVVRIPLYGGLSTENLLKEIARRYRDLVD
ncbi:MAG: D-glycero-beta-D-manno-heptose 1-phosphate adenylyltransferase [Candidatus Eisenbacteria bacterium]